MPRNVEEPVVPPGAILTAVTMVEALDSGDGDGQAFATAATEIPRLVRQWGVPVLTQAFGLFIGTALTLVEPRPGDPDRLSLVVPAVTTKLRTLGLAQSLLPTMAGVLTAAAMEQNPWRWREGLGPIGNAEALAWCLTAWVVADLVDEVVLGEHGKFTRMLAAMVSDAGPVPDDAGALDGTL